MFFPAFLRFTTRWPFITSLKRVLLLFVRRLTLMFEKFPPAAFDLHLWRFSETALCFGYPLPPSLPSSHLLTLPSSALPDPHPSPAHTAHPSSNQPYCSACDATETCFVKWSVQLTSSAWALENDSYLTTKVTFIMPVTVEE